MMQRSLLRSAASTCGARTSSSFTASSSTATAATAVTSSYLAFNTHNNHMNNSNYSNPFVNRRNLSTHMNNNNHNNNNKQYHLHNSCFQAKNTIWSSAMNMYHINIIHSEQQSSSSSSKPSSTTAAGTPPVSNPSSSGSSGSAGGGENQDELLEKMIKRSSTAAQLLKPPTVQDRIDALKLKTIAFMQKIPGWTWRMTVILARGSWDFAKNPVVVKDWYAIAKKKVVHEMKHYYSGFKLLMADIRSACRLTLKIFKGHTMTRRERNHLVRTTSDIFRLVPFAFFLIVPFMELLLPVAIKLFPNMLPSQFEDKLKKEEQLRREFKAKLELGKFLQDTVELMAFELKKSDQAETVATAEELQKFVNLIRKGEPVRNEDIIRFAKLFSDEITLDNVSRAQLMAMCRMVGISPYGSDFYLRFRLRTKIRQLKADDRLIYWEGVKSLSREELMYACQARGMKVVLSQEKMQQQLKDWIDLSLNKNVPASLLLLSRAFTYTNEVDVKSSDAIKMALGSLSDDVLGEVALQSAPGSTGNVYEKKLESVKRQDKLIQEEEESRKEKGTTATPAVAAAASKVAPATTTTTTTAAVDESERDVVERAEKHQKIQALNELLATLASESSLRNEREQLDALINDHIELIGETTADTKPQAYQNRLNKIQGKIGELIGKLEEDIEHVDSAIGDSLNMMDKDKDGVISVDEVRETLKLLKDKPSDDVVEEIITRLDKNNDGKISLKEILLELKSAIKDA